MLKKELRDFQAFVDENAIGTARCPSLLSVLTKPGKTELALETPEEKKKRMMRSLSLRIAIVIPEEMRGFCGRVLRLRGVLGHCYVLIDGKKVLEWRYPPDTVTVALPDAGEHFEVEICFPMRAVPSDVGLSGSAELIAFSHDLITDV